MYKCIHIAAYVVCDLGRTLKNREYYMYTGICIRIVKYLYKYVYKRILIYDEGCGIKKHIILNTIGKLIAHL